MSILSKSCIYGLRAAVYIAAYAPEAGYVPIREVADKLGLSFHFLTKIFQSLTQHGMMASYRGPNGGVALARPASQITVRDIVRGIDGLSSLESCLLGLAGCSDQNPCPMHVQWARERSRMGGLFGRTRLSELARRVREGGLRLTD
jgi:Rrf2 family transcriptional regulator, iron-sulfur cluster assembly transcription factor